ncbi:hypothetical protein BH11ACT8_BH11ACT8_26290 [soil metagenome]
MADEQTDQPSLEPPKLFGRRKRRSAPAAESVETITPVENEPVEAGPVEAGPVETGPVETGPVETEPVEAGPTETQQIETGPIQVEDAPSTGDTRVFEDAAAGLAETSDQESAAEPGTTTTEQRPAKVRRPLRVPALVGRIAAVVTGVIVGAAILGLTSLGFRVCEASRGTNSCGTGPGMALLIVIFLLAVLLGRLLLGLFKVPDPASTSFLAVGLTSVVALLFFVDQLDTWPMLIVIPALTAVTYLLSWWVTTTYVEPASH